MRRPNIALQPLREDEMGKGTWAPSDNMQRRLRAAGLARPEGQQDVNADEPIDIDALRNGIARRLAIMLNQGDWKKCPYRICRRNRGCMAPENSCTMSRPLPPDPTGRREAETMALVRRMLDEHADKRDVRPKGGEP